LWIEPFDVWMNEEGFHDLPFAFDLSVFDLAEVEG
jgi:hypothetical protein